MRLATTLDQPARQHARSRPPVALIGIFRQGLAEQGYLEGCNVVIDYRHVDNQYERLAELARRQVAVIAALNSPPALAARVSLLKIHKAEKQLRGPAVPSRHGDDSLRSGFDLRLPVSQPGFAGT